MAKRKPWGLFLAIMAAVVLLMVIMYVPLLGGGTAAFAATSPLARIAILTIVVGCALLGLIALRLRRLTERPHPRCTKSGPTRAAPPPSKCSWRCRLSWASF